MTIRVALRHLTDYRYDRRVNLGPQVVRLRPAAHSVTVPLRYTMDVSPGEHFLHWQQDPLGNHQARLVFPEKTDHFRVDVELVADLEPLNPFDFFVEPEAVEMPLDYEDALTASLRPFLRTKDYGPRFAALIDDLRPEAGARTVDWMVGVNQELEQRIDYVVRMEPGVQTPEETLELGKGSCRDTGWLLVELLRHYGVASRFVSGYLIQLVHDVKPLEGPSGPSADFTDLHAWAEAFVPGAGWIGFDPTSGMLASEGHIPLACTPVPGAAAPVTGALDECEVEFHHEMTVRRILETPRVTRPYEPSTWRSIEALGRRLDRELKDEDVRLWMGGEPTFVSIDDYDSPEWNTAALGGDKKERAENLFERMVGHYASGGLRHYGQGKWYPGESLPRWALTAYFRADGEPIWRDEKLVARPGRQEAPDDARVKAFGETLCEALGVASTHLQEGYEDALYHLWRERRLPSNLSPKDNRLAWEEERERIARVFEQGLGHQVGLALPLRARRPLGADRAQWETGSFFLRREHLFLMPGDSPMGYRLPLDSLPWIADIDRDQLGAMDPYGDFPPLPGAAHPRHAARRDPVPAGPGMHQRDPDRRPLPFESAADVVRTALCLEVREGMLHIFMPPTPDAAAYLELVRAIEETAAQVETPVRLEGYTPPSDPQLKSFSVTPDPGVIEVNIHPSASWDELSEKTRTLYQMARESRLGSDKFLLDGRHVGTGGGNHVTLGSSSPMDSPLLRTPDLLKSMVGYWLDHPSLSYLFSGLFIGPTSQAPRVDEARHDSVRELEIAFDELERQDGNTPPWLVDRLFRHLLTDVTGNTHRAEFCIDKLYSPDGPTGRKGILELRNFEMPPHPEMSLTQALLMRSLVAWFWREPYRSHRARWGTQLHDRFMLPHYVEQDFHEVLEDLQHAGYPLERSWYAPHMEFRFPLVGTVDTQGLELEVRTALEPWHVLGEEGAVGGTARYVDASLERLQVKLRGGVEGRHRVLVNGRAAPAQPTGTRGETVAGIRFRAWQSPSCLHPTIGVHGPLRIEVVDERRRRSLGGCTYHVAHPDGRSYETLPVNAEEAGARRRARFVPFGHTPGELHVPRPDVDPDMPLTLDLRRVPAGLRERPVADRHETEGRTRREGRLTGGRRLS
ncbi:MAG: IMP dehydrogenase [Sandaracinus sp.]|nr:IMP dehydrogenase [Sandaracinus sp.]